VLAQAASLKIDQIGADEQQAIHAGKSGFQRSGVVKIGLTHRYATLGEIRQFVRRAGGGDDGSGICFEQQFQHTASELAGCARHEQCWFIGHDAYS
jgi:hypothetical protein